jgi:hypothetical protein
MCEAAIERPACRTSRVGSEKAIEPTRAVGTIGYNNPATIFSFSHVSMKSNCSATQSPGTAC